MKSETARIPSKLIFSPGGEGGGIPAKHSSRR